MSAQYSDSLGPLLAVDTASPTISVAVGDGGVVLARRVAASGRASPSLLQMIDDVLAEAELPPEGLGSALGVRGPGSFTGLRVGLSTLLGLHRSLGLPATAVPTFVPLAWQDRTRPGTVIAVVDALRGEWFSQRFRAGAVPTPLEEPVLREPRDLAALEARSVVGFRLGALDAAGLGSDLREACPLASALIEWAAAAEIEWDARLLTEPLYLRPPATTPPRRS